MRRLGVGVGLLAVLGIVGTLGWLASKPDQPAFASYTVVKGDTLFLIARDQGVSVEQLREWNGIEGDLIEVGQVIRIGPAGTESPPAPQWKGARSNGGSEAPAPEAVDGFDPLVMPSPKPCLEGPSLEGIADVDEAMVGNAGLSPNEIKAAMNGFLPETLRCLADVPDRPTQTLVMEVTVACSGVVEHIAVTHHGDWTPEVASCVTRVLTHTPFPAHDLPNGEIFQFPLTFTAN